MKKEKLSVPFYRPTIGKEEMEGVTSVIERGAVGDS